MTITDSLSLYDFSDSAQAADWIVVNDGVMGGVSRSQVAWQADGGLRFSGVVSLENKGGFASTRTRPRAYELAGYDGIWLRVRGDGQRYSFRIRTSGDFDRISYSYAFGTQAESWQELYLPFEDFVPTFRGRQLRGVPPLSAGAIRQLGVLISDKQAGPFSLSLDFIKAYRTSP